MKPRHLVVLGLLSLAAYLPGAGWGLPHATSPDRVQAWGVDDESPMGPLAEISHIVREPAPDRNLGYPLMHSFTVAAAYTPYLGYLFVSGRFRSPGSEYPFGFAEPVETLRTLTLIAHWVSVLAAALTVIAAYLTATWLWDPRTGMWAGLFTLVLYPMFYYGRTGNVDALQLSFMALCLAAFAAWLRRPRSVAAMVGVGTFGGLALATKEPIFAAFLPIPVVTLVILWRDTAGREGAGSWTFWRGPVYGVAALVLAFGLGSGLFVEPGRYMAHLRFAQQRVADVASGTIAFADTYPNTLAGNAALAGALFDYVVDSLTLPGVVLAAIGVVWTATRRTSAWVMALPALTYVVVLMTTARVGFLRYLMPVAWVAALFAARAVVLGLEHRNRGLRFALTGLGGIALALGALRGIDLTHAMLNDSRYAAGAWLAERADSGDVVEYFGPTQKLPPLARGVRSERATPYLGGLVRHPRDSATAAAIAAGWDERRPDFIIAMPDYTSEPTEDWSNSHPPALFRGLMEGRYGYRLAAEFETPSALPWVGRPSLDYRLVNPTIRIFTPRP